MEEYLYAEMYELEDKHWWFVTRKHIIISLLRRYLKKSSENKILDAGCGCGSILRNLQYMGQAFGMDASPEALKFSKSRFRGVVKQGFLPDDIPWPENYFDAILLLDVLEHLEQDSKSLRSLGCHLKSDGVLLLTVPAYMFLWSSHDEVHQHYRRYTKKELSTKLLESGYKIQKISYFNTLLFPPIAIIRLLHNRLKISSGSDANLPPPFLNWILKSIFSIEAYLLRYFNFPFGVSIIVVATKVCDELK
jgi:2-polyprenyl-3-methyl-5-hydroxy-6-metoxy-1,4-benzoquinol methylase